MTDKLKEEIAQMEAEEVKAAEEQKTEEVVQEEQQPNEEQEEKITQEIPEGAAEAPKEEDGAPTEEELKAKQKAYRERQEKRKRDEEERAKRELEYQERIRAQADKKQEADENAYLKQVAIKMQQQEMVKAAKRELSVMEKEFVEAYPDYREKVDDAIEFTKQTMMKKGMSEAEALETLEYEKVMLADNAVRLGKDPVEAVYREAQVINEVIDEFAAKKGYVRPDNKTSLQKVREIAKPSPIGGGTGTRAVHKGLMDEDNDDLDNMTLEQMLEAKKAGAL